MKLFGLSMKGIKGPFVARTGRIALFADCAEISFSGLKDCSGRGRIPSRSERSASVLRNGRGWLARGPQRSTAFHKALDTTP